MVRPIIAMLTDFGTRDYYVAAMKAVILGITPDVTLVDITHEIAPQDVTAAAFTLAACYRDFTPGTIFVVVVDPGVGTRRKALAVGARDYLFVAPDNGVLGAALSGADYKAVQITDSRFVRADISRTFEGRDRFAPAAAWLAHGKSLDDLGPPVSGVVGLTLPQPREDEAGVAGEIVTVDHFGNLVSNIDATSLDRCGGATSSVRVGDGHFVPVVRTYGEAPAGDLCALVGSSGFLEIAVNGGSAAERLSAGRGTAIAVVRDHRRAGQG